MTAINLAGPDDDTRVLSLMARYHEERGLPYDDTHRAAVAAPLLDTNPLGAIWLVGPARAPLGYILVTFGWSVVMGGMVGTVAEVFIRPSVRKRGIGTEVMHTVAVSLGKAGVRALHVQLPQNDDASARFCARVGFALDSPMMLMTDAL